MRRLSPAKVPSFLRVAAPLAAVAVLAAACSSGTSSPTSSAPTTSSAATGAAAAGAAFTVEAKSGPAGTYLTDATGRTLYLWTADTGSTSTCSGSCATAWPPATSSATPAAGSGVTGSQLGLSKRADGTEQVTYDGHPLYYFAGDSSAGQMNGQGSTGFGAAWWLVAPSGSAIMGSAGGASSSSTSGASSTSTASGSSWS